MDENHISKIVLGEAIAIHRELGPGLFESVYEEILYRELNKKGLQVSRQEIVPIKYRPHSQ